KTDPFKRPISMQSWKSRHSAQGVLRDSGILDFDSLHMGHSDRDSAVNCIRVVRELHSREPHMPVIPGEVVFEGIGWQNWQNMQRYCFWGSMLSGAAGYCYGANGIWQFNRKGEPFGASPHGRTWGGDAWDVAMNYPGSAQIGIAKKLLQQYPFWKIEPHQEWIGPLKREQPDIPPFAAGIPDELRLFYLWQGFARGASVRGIEPGTRYRAFWFDPANGTRTDIGAVQPEADGSWNIPLPPGIWDFVLVLSKS
ncbi:MAG: glycoside hydrolase family 140 protein, partial [Acidobacteria bacterium]|nr:glycoside hydrolase family 140 protein [Acidobacteriota bacterium]